MLLAIGPRSASGAGSSCGSGVLTPAGGQFYHPGQLRHTWDGRHCHAEGRWNRWNAVSGCPDDRPPRRLACSQSCSCISQISCAQPRLGHSLQRCRQTGHSLEWPVCYASDRSRSGSAIYSAITVPPGLEAAGGFFTRKPLLAQQAAGHASSRKPTWQLMSSSFVPELARLRRGCAVSSRGCATLPGMRPS